MRQAEIDQAIDGLLFDVRRSVRYHDRRRAFYELVHRLTAVLTILMAGSILFEVGTNATKHASWLVCLSVVAALFATLDMVIGYASKADLHRGLKVAFGALEIAIVQGAKTEANLIAWQAKRLEIEQDEPPIYRALDLLCYNELVMAMGLGKEHTHEVKPWQCWTRHFLHHANI